MSAPQIPNLAALRRGNLRPRGRGSGISEGWTPDQPRQKQNKDDIIRNTDNDAATSRLSAIEAGYLDDPFAKLFSTSDEVPRRLPLMNRGTYVRTTAIDRVVETFLTASEKSNGGGLKQIISLGAGSDTRFFRLRRQHPSLRGGLIFHELDFASNTRAKIERLQRPGFNKLGLDLCDLNLGSDCVEILDNGSRLRSTTYCIHPIDLRTLSPTSAPLRDLNTSLPTLLISECCLIYLSPEDADSVLNYFTSLFPADVSLGMIIYEPIRPHDAFGRTMVSNLTARAIVLQTMEKYKDLPEQRQRLLDVGFREPPTRTEGQGGESIPQSDISFGKPKAVGATFAIEDNKRDGGGAQSADLDFIWRHWITQDEKDIVEKLEWMDEVEEFVLLGRHYCVSWGWRGFRWNSDEIWKKLTAPDRV